MDFVTVVVDGFDVIDEFLVRAFARKSMCLGFKCPRRSIDHRVELFRSLRSNERGASLLRSLDGLQTGEWGATFVSAPKITMEPGPTLFIFNFDR